MYDPFPLVEEMLKKILLSTDIICKRCLFGKMQWKPQCWCTDVRQDFYRFKQLMLVKLEMVLASYQKYSGAPVGNGMID